MLAWLGGLAIVLGVVFFLVMAVRNGWIDEPTRVVLAFGGASALLAVGLYLYERRGQTEAAIAAVSAAIAALYATVTAATQLYDLIDPALGLGVAALIGAAATAIAVRWDSPLVAALGILGALVSPVLVDSGTSGVTLVFMAIALASATGVVVWRRWDWLAQAAFLISAPQLLFWVGDTYEDDLALCLVVLPVFWALYVVAAIGYELRVPTEKLRPSSGMLLVANGLLLSGAGWAMLDDTGHSTAGTAWVIGVSLAHIALGSASLRGRMSREIALLLLAVAIGLSAVALALAFDGPALVAAWAVEAVLLTWLAARSGGDRRTYLAAAVFLGLATVVAGSIALDDIDYGEEHRTATVAAALIMLASFAMSRLYAGPWPEVRRALEILGAAAAAYLPVPALDGVWLVAAWAAEAALVTAYGRRARDEGAVGAAAAFLALAAGHVLVFEASPDGLRSGVEHLGAASLGIALVAAGAVLAARYAPAQEDVRKALEVGAAVALVYLPSIAIVDKTATDGAVGLGQTPQVLLSTFWGLTGLCALVLGLLRDERRLRLGGLVLLGITVVKVFLYDLSELESIYRVLSFIALGLLLLVGAFAYQRLRVVVQEDDAP